MIFFYLNFFIHIAISLFVFSQFFKWKKKGFKKPFTEENWLKLAVLAVAILPVTFIYGFIETTSPSTEYLTEGEIEWCDERSVKLKDCEQSWPLR